MKENKFWVFKKKKCKAHCSVDFSYIIIIYFCSNVMFVCQESLKETKEIKYKRITLYFL